MISSPIRLCVLCLAPLLLVGMTSRIQPTNDRVRADADSANNVEKRVKTNAIEIHYLEIVTPSVNATCEILMKAHGVVFSDPVAELGNARTAELKDGGRIGVRAPMRETEQPVVRPYVLVDDIDAAIKAAELAGANVAIPPMEIPGHGTFSIYTLGGIEHGLWQL